VSLWFLDPLVPDWLVSFWTLLFAVVYFTAGTLGVLHAILNKRRARSSLLWVGLILFAPIMGALLYFLFGINRVRRRAVTLRAAVEWPPEAPATESATRRELSDSLPDDAQHLLQLKVLAEKAIEKPLLPGNRIVPLMNGDEAYPEMLAAIEGAQHSIALLSYIFDVDPWGRRFADALVAAKDRGVEVRVLVDDAGAHYSWKQMPKELRKRGVRAASFNPRMRVLPTSVLNLRSHRKAMIVDGTLGFTGGMNIRAGCVLAEDPKMPTQDVHFRVEGPVIAHLRELFSKDWAFADGEILSGEKWFPPLEECGNTFARGIPDGPDEDFARLYWTLAGAITLAQRSIKIVTPYFLPEDPLISALNIASMRGVEVDIIVPEKSNLFLVQWAMNATLWQILWHDCRLWFTPGPFDHSKLMVVDDHWVLLGSANVDPRSLRLNFEFNLECYGGEFAAAVSRIVDQKRDGARRIALVDLERRTLPARVRDGIARLFHPML